MGIRIRTRRASGTPTDELFVSEEDGFTMLADTLDGHLSNGHRIKRTGNSYRVTDDEGEFLQEIVLVLFVDEGPRTH